MSRDNYVYHDVIRNEKYRYRWIPTTKGSPYKNDFPEFIDEDKAIDYILDRILNETHKLKCIEQLNENEIMYLQKLGLHVFTTD